MPSLKQIYTHTIRHRKLINRVAARVRDPQFAFSFRGVWYGYLLGLSEVVGLEFRIFGIVSRC